MAVTNFSPLLGLALPTTGDLSGTWGTTVNDSITGLLDSAVAGTTTLSTDADVTLTTTNGAANQARNAVLLCTGARTTLKTITAPAQSKAYVVINATTGGFSVKVVGSGPTTPGVTVANGEKALIAWNGSDFVLISKSVIDLTADVKGILPVVNGGTGVATSTGTVAVVLSTSPTLVTPILGTPQSVTLTNATGLPISSGVSGLGTNVATALAVNVGSAGALVVNGGALGTPSSGTLTNATGLPLSTGVTGLLPVANGGTGTATPSLVQGTNITITGTWPNQTIAASGGGASAATPTALGTVYGKQTTSGGSPYLTAYGYNAGVSTTGANATAVGLNALYTNVSGVSCTAVGYEALYLSTASSCTAVGSNALRANTVGSNVALGSGAGLSNTTGQILAIGTAVLSQNTTGTGNTAVGSTGTGFTAPLSTNTTGSYNSAFGEGTLANNTGSYNTALGAIALYSNTTVSNNTAVGYRSLYNSTTADSNTAVGVNAGFNVTTGSNNTIYGISAMGGSSAFTGNSNVVVGEGALFPATTATGNSSLGYRSLYSNTTGNSNTSIGNTSLYSCTTGFDNSVLGKEAGYNITTGGANICIGSASGQVLSTGLRNIHIGYLTNGSSSSVSDEMHISTGSSTTGKGGSTGFINPNGGSLYQGNNTTTFATISDRRLKKNIVDNNTGLEKLTQIQVRNFEYRLAEEITELPQAQAIQKSGVQLGVIAQELQAVLPECVKTESTGVLRVDADNLTWYMINAIKELKAEFDAYKLTHP